jgi:hypothetical protein
MPKIRTRRLCLILTSALLALAALVGAAASLADTGPTYAPAENIITFAWPKEAKLTKGSVPIVKLACNPGCDHSHAFFTLKHGKKVVSKNALWTESVNPEILAPLRPYGKQQLHLHKQLSVVAKVCIHPPGPQNYCQTHRVMLRG